MWKLLVLEINKTTTVAKKYLIKLQLELEISRKFYENYKSYFYTRSNLTEGAQ